MFSEQPQTGIVTIQFMSIISFIMTDTLAIYIVCLSGWLI